MGSQNHKDRDRGTDLPPKLSKVQGLVNNDMGKQGPGQLLPLLGLEEPFDLLDGLLPPVNLGDRVLLRQNKSSLPSQVSCYQRKFRRVPCLKPNNSWISKKGKLVIQVNRVDNGQWDMPHNCLRRITFL